MTSPAEKAPSRAYQVLLTLTGGAALALLALPSIPGVALRLDPPAPTALSTPLAGSAPEAQPERALSWGDRRFVPGSYVVQEAAADGRSILRGTWVDRSDPTRGFWMGLEQASRGGFGRLEGLGTWSGASWTLESTGKAGQPLRIRPMGDSMRLDSDLLTGSLAFEVGSEDDLMESSGSWSCEEFLVGEDVWSSSAGAWGRSASGQCRGSLVLGSSADPEARLSVELLLARGGSVDGVITGLGSWRGLHGLLTEAEWTSDRDGEVRLAGQWTILASTAGLAVGDQRSLAAELKLARAGELRWEPALPDGKLTRVSEAGVLALERVSRSFQPVGDWAWVEGDSGTAQLRGELEDSQDRRRRFELNLHFVGRVAPGALRYEALDQPLLELATSAYAEQGGPVDPSSWIRYEYARGELTGLGKLEGTRLELRSRAPLQLGLGASGTGLEWGALVALEAEVLEGPATFPTGTLGAVLRGHLK